ncbi:hypothetical protein KL933_001165 [Ogataea haglerorum]|uniref:Uncharacterized protein n=1 Tax=Ogataea haglerorum TaxID=1937702 RepID=A0AAN6I209_9ASCO|nr:hypothetical protein KL933_001165 [Ogataea haglerorum]KAG7760448.1 hypothetical protein KL947_001292 [Ogataea haglerorum]
MYTATTETPVGRCYGTRYYTALATPTIQGYDVKTWGPLIITSAEKCISHEFPKLWFVHVKLQKVAVSKNSIDNSNRSTAQIYKCAIYV